MNPTTELLETIYSQYENHSPFAVIIRVVLQVVLPAPKMDDLFILLILENSAILHLNHQTVLVLPTRA
ncbi:MAG: hypothetical protein LBC02_07040 [Planctomycetaceae bacterium]|nr:hypothetical protein [Planctomycetaceae bacterium]